MPEPNLVQLRGFLESLQPSAQLITYQELALAINMPPPHRIHRLTLMLEELVREDHAAGRPLIAALAVSRGMADRAGTAIPGRGFFHLLKDLGRYDGPDRGPEAIARHKLELEQLRLSGAEAS